MKPSSIAVAVTSPEMILDSLYRSAYERRQGDQQQGLRFQGNATEDGSTSCSNKTFYWTDLKWHTGFSHCKIKWFHWWKIPHRNCFLLRETFILIKRSFSHHLDIPVGWKSRFLKRSVWDGDGLHAPSAPIGVTAGIRPGSLITDSKTYWSACWVTGWGKKEMLFSQFGITSALLVD